MPEIKTGGPAFSDLGNVGVMTDAVEIPEDVTKLIEKYAGGAYNVRRQHIPLSVYQDHFREFAPEVARTIIADRATREERKPDYVYDPEAWEWTHEYSDRNAIMEECGADYGKVVAVNTLFSGPQLFAVRIGDEENADEIKWFNSREEADAFASAWKANNAID